MAAEPSGGVRLGYPGVTVHLRFRGEGLELRARATSGDACFDVTIDGGEPRLLRLRVGEGGYALARGLAPRAEHTVALARRTESWQGVCTLENFTLAAGGEWCEAPTLAERRLLFVGDSVTCGEMAGWTPGTVAPFPIAANNALRSYGMLLARRLGAQCHLVSYGGRGVLRDWQGFRHTVNAPRFFDLALPDDPAAVWDHARYVPDAVGVQLGTNDFNQGVPAESEFVGAYVEFIRRIRRHAPSAWIVVIDSPIVTDQAGVARRSVLRAYLDAVVGQAGDERTVRATLRHYSGVPGNGHPMGADHVAMADELEPVFRRALDG